MRRIHAKPDPRKLRTLTEFIAELGFQTGSLESRFELQKLLGSIHGRPEEHAVNYAVLRSLQRAVYSPEEDGHYALASKCYCHFTSPIRRYPDLTIHRLIDGLLAKKKPVNDIGQLVTQGEHCSEREQRAEAAERELTKLKLLIYMSNRIGEQLDAVVTGVEEFGLFVQGIKVPAEGLVHVTTLADDYYRFDRKSHTLTGNRSGNALPIGRLGESGSGAGRHRSARVRFPRRAAQGAFSAAGKTESRQGEESASDEGRRKEAAEEV